MRELSASLCLGNRARSGASCHPVGNRRDTSQRWYPPSKSQTSTNRGQANVVFETPGICESRGSCRNRLLYGRAGRWRSRQKRFDRIPECGACWSCSSATSSRLYRYAGQRGAPLFHGILSTRHCSGAAANAGGKRRYVWTTGSWLLYEYLEQASPGTRRHGAGCSPR